MPILLIILWNLAALFAACAGLLLFVGCWSWRIAVERREGKTRWEVRGPAIRMVDEGEGSVLTILGFRIGGKGKKKVETPKGEKASKPSESEESKISEPKAPKIAEPGAYKEEKKDDKKPSKEEQKRELTWRDWLDLLSEERHRSLVIKLLKEVTRLVYRLLRRFHPESGRLYIRAGLERPDWVGYLSALYWAAIFPWTRPNWQVQFTPVWLEETFDWEGDAAIRLRPLALPYELLITLLRLPWIACWKAWRVIRKRTRRDS